MSKKKEQDLSLNDFTWDENVEDFFGIKATEEEENTQKVIEQFANEVDDEDDEDNEDEFDKEMKEKKAVTVKTKKDIDNNAEDDDDEEHDDEDNEKNKKSSKDKSFKKTEKFFENELEEEVVEESDLIKTVKSLKEKGVFSFAEIKEDTEFNEETLEDFFEAELEGRLNEELSNFATSLDEDAKLFLEFKKNGGKTSDFLKVFENDDIITSFEGVDFNEDENKAEQFLKEYYYQIDDVDEDEIEDKIEFLKERGKLSITAEKAFEKVSEKQKKEKEELNKSQEKARKAQLDKQKKYSEDLKKAIIETEVVGKIKINKKDKQEIFNYLMLPSIKLENGKKVTAFQKDLADVYNDKKMLIAFAKIIKDRFEISDLDVATKTVKQIKQTLRAGSKSETRKSLADFF